MKTNNPHSRWQDDTIQFPRLIAELEANGAFTPGVLSALEESMDLTIPDLCDLIERAQASFDRIKAPL